MHVFNDIVQLCLVVVDKFFLVEGVKGNVFTSLGNCVGIMFGNIYNLEKLIAIVLQDLLLCW